MPIMKGSKIMKILEIRDKKGWFLSILPDATQPGEITPIDQINKEGLMMLLDLYINRDDIEMDLYEGQQIENPAQQIIYKSIFDNFSELMDSKNKFKDEGERLYLDAIQKYKVPETDDF